MYKSYQIVNKEKNYVYATGHSLMDICSKLELIAKSAEAAGEKVTRIDEENLELGPLILYVLDVTP